MSVYSAAKRGLMAVWYPYVRALNAAWPSIEIAGKRLAILPGVYKPLENEAACAAWCRAGDRVLDLGCGSGVNTVFCAPTAREVVAVDISAEAVRNTEANCERFGLASVTVRQSDMFANVEGRFDLIVANPPYIAADFADENQQFATSVRYLPTLFAEAGDHLAPEGRLLVQFPLWFRGRIEKLAASHGLDVIEVRRLPPKSLKLMLLSLGYLQVGFRSAFYLLRPMRPENLAIAAE